MSDKNSEDKKSKPGRRFSQEQYDFLLECSRKNKKDKNKRAGTDEWNKWRKENPSERICVEGANLVGVNLENADLHGADLEHADLTRANLIKANLSDAQLNKASIGKTNFSMSDLTWAILDEAGFLQTNFEKANMVQAQIKNAKVWQSSFREAKLDFAKLEKSHFSDSDLSNAVLQYANLKQAEICRVNLQNANMYRSNLEGSNLKNTDLADADLREVDLRNARIEDKTELQGTNFRKAIVSGSTLITDCIVDDNTDFREVGLNDTRIDSELIQLLEYNNRRLNWEEWYKKGTWYKQILKRKFVKPFWWTSDYGHRTGRIVYLFFIFALLFAGIYFAWGKLSPPGIVTNLFVDYNGPEPVEVSTFEAIFRAGYFSIVTMTTLGFGDMHAQVGTFWGYIFLTIQVLLGYVFLGALITRLAILFTAGGPSAKFSTEK